MIERAGTRRNLLRTRWQRAAAFSTLTYLALVGCSEAEEINVSTHASSAKCLATVTELQPDGNVLVSASLANSNLAASLAIIIYSSDSVSVGTSLPLDQEQVVSLPQGDPEAAVQALITGTDGRNESCPKVMAATILAPQG